MISSLLLPALLYVQQIQTHSPSPETLSPAAFYRLRQRTLANDGSLTSQEAADSYKRLLATNPADGQLWLDLGGYQYDLKQYAEAAASYERSIELGHGNKAVTEWLIAQCFSQLGEKNQAFKWLDRALSDGFYERPILAADDQLAGLRGDARFKKIAGLPPKEEGSREKRWRYDIDFLIGEIKRLHYRWRKEHLPGSILTGAHRLKDTVSKLDDEAIATRMQKLVMLLQDGHSRVIPISPKIGFTMLPVQFYRFEEGTFIVRGTHAGARVLSMGGRPIEELWKELPAYVSRDNDQGIQWAGPQYLALTGVLRDLAVNIDSAGIPLSLVDPDGHPVETHIQPVPVTNEFVAHVKLGPPSDPAKAPLYLRNVADYYWTQDIPEAKALYVQLNQVNGKKGETLPEFGKRLRRDLKASWRENLVFDLRHNSGGYPLLAQELVRTLLWYSAEGGRLFVVTGRNTFSASQTLLNNLVKNANAIVVGEPSSSSPIFIGNVTTVVLPYSGLKVCVSATMNTVDPSDHRLWIAPEIPVPVRAADYFANRDAALQAILEVIEGS